MKIACFTPRNVEPLHPRLVVFREFFESHGIQMVFINRSTHKGLLSRINWLSLWFFDLYAIGQCKSLIADFDLIFVTDLKYLPLVEFAKKSHKVVFYDTIDHNVELRFHQLQRKFPVVHVFKKIIIAHFSRKEKAYVDRYCDEVFVNSDSLAQYFNNRAHRLFYSSPLENLTSVNDPAKPAALLYLGAFTKDKGAMSIISLSQVLGVRLIVYGRAEDKLVSELAKNNIFYCPHISIAQLKTEIEDHMSRNFLFGISLIDGLHLSYAMQEANKDIDYLALGVPIIGNYRKATREKIELGCGLFFDDPRLHQKIEDSSGRQKLSLAARKLYQEKYRRSHFFETVDRVMNPYLS